MEDLRRCGGEDLLVCRYTTWRRTSFEPCPIVNFPIHNGDSWTKGPKHWDISRCCLCHHRPTPLAQHYYENIWNYSSAYLWKIYPGIVSRIAKPNNVCQLRIDERWRAGGKRRKRDQGIDLSLFLSISLLEISCNFDSRGVQVSRGREIFGTPARIVVDGSTRDERIDACQFRYYFSWGSILFLLS